MRRKATDAEARLWLHLRAGRLLGFKFKRQQPLGDYIVDFVCFESRLVIEVDGGQHADQAERDAERSRWLQSQGFTVMRFWNDEVLQKTEDVLESVICALRAYPSPQPLSHKGRGAQRAGRSDAGR
jgi:very-short-patch-repair endonuclease